MTDKGSSVDRVYETLRDMAINFDFKPGERLNETHLTSKLNVSRTPLREALNRLVAEGFLTLAKGQGFFCRALSPEQILELYQLRCALETEALRIGISTAGDEDIAAFCAYLDETEKTYGTCEDLSELLNMDEEFHMRLAGLCGNGELCRTLKNVNERIRYVRLVNLRQLRENGAQASENSYLSAHRVVADAVRARDTDKAVTALRAHIERRREQTIELVRLAYSQLYVPAV
ncbi:GntR family transcriptional regulator [Halocynthiibacter styelae]|uniref:GntR family transcriptional regulator n=1 Tax=Halocynthiibacter styelae TaxID=2761955 RepID=A0A8J7IY55_9RHOB|nr:GntR family transcriptional regulator [Paenihalocynthiibacter styelae]MBI1495018.1 GntR family transcriptional regulator [Paenihalocynthiibacter styelae]